MTLDRLLKMTAVATSLCLVSPHVAELASQLGVTDVFLLISTLGVTKVIIILSQFECIP